MIEVEDTIISRDVIETFFCCDLDACGGACCIEGESGAPVLESEKEAVCMAYPLVEHLIPEKNKQYIESKGLMYYDDDNDLVTNIIGGRECVFTCYESNGSCRCAFEKGFSTGVNEVFYKPISCHLYPIRLTQYRDFIAVNYHRWEICEAARTKGEQLGLRLYKFLREPLIKAFGEAWYEKLEHEAELYLNTITNE